MEIESRLLPCGLHVVGEPPSAMEAIATLVNIAEIDRPDLEKPIKGLPGILARAIGRNVEEIYKANNLVSCAQFPAAPFLGLITDIFAVGVHVGLCAHSSGSGHIRRVSGKC